MQRVRLKNSGTDVSGSAKQIVGRNVRFKQLGPRKVLLSLRSLLDFSERPFEIRVRFPVISGFPANCVSQPWPESR